MIPSLIYIVTNPLPRKIQSHTQPSQLPKLGQALTACPRLHSCSQLPSCLGPHHPNTIKGRPPNHLSPNLFFSFLQAQSPTPTLSARQPVFALFWRLCFFGSVAVVVFSASCCRHCSLGPGALLVFRPRVAVLAFRPRVAVPVFSALLPSLSASLPCRFSRPCCPRLWPRCLSGLLGLVLPCFVS